MTNYFYTYNMIFDVPVSGNAKLVYAYLCKCADTNGKCYPSHKAISENAGIGVTTVKKALAELERAGLISIQGQARPDRGRRANIYTVIKEKLNGFFLSYANIFTSTLTAKARLVYLYFCRLASGREQAYPSHKTTAKTCGLSVAGVRAAIDELEASGHISRQAQYRDNGGQRANLYTILTEQEKNPTSNAPKQAANNPTAEEDTICEEPSHDVEAANDDAAMSSVDKDYADDFTLNIETVHVEKYGEMSYSSSSGISFISGKSKKLEIVKPNPCDMRCNVRTLGFFVLPLIIFSIVDCFIPDNVASLFIVMLWSWHWLKIRIVMTSEYVMALSSFLPEYG
jgi:predicted ArsR family transcriptional regulator